MRRKVESELVERRAVAEVGIRQEHDLH